MLQFLILLLLPDLLLLNNLPHIQILTKPDGSAGNRRLRLRRENLLADSRRRRKHKDSHPQYKDCARYALQPFHGRTRLSDQTQKESGPFLLSLSSVT